jgi:hypothetical protein
MTSYRSRRRDFGCVSSNKIYFYLMLNRRAKRSTDGDEPEHEPGTPAAPTGSPPEERRNPVSSEVECVSPPVGPRTRFGQPGGPDPVEVGRRGGLASGRARDPLERHRRRLRDKLLSDSGFGSYSAYRALAVDLDGRERALREERRVLDRERQEFAALDRQVVQLMDWKDHYAAEVFRLKDEERLLVAVVADLKREQQELGAAIAAEAEAHDFEYVPDEGDVASAP